MKSLAKVYAIKEIAFDYSERNKLNQGLHVIIISTIVFAVSITVALIVTIYVAEPPVRNSSNSHNNTK